MNKYIVSNKDTIYLLKSHNTLELKNVALSYKDASDPDFVVFFDSNGNVIARSNSDVIGDKAYENLFKKVVNSTGYTSMEVLDSYNFV